MSPLAFGLSSRDLFLWCGGICPAVCGSWEHVGAGTEQSMVVGCPHPQASEMGSQQLHPTDLLSLAMSLSRKKSFEHALGRRSYCVSEGLVYAW